MRVLLTGVLLGLLHGVLAKSYNTHEIKVPYVVRGPFGNEEAIIQEYFRRFLTTLQHPHERKPAQTYSKPSEEYYPDENERTSSFDRGHVESRPFRFADTITFKKSGSTQEGYLPLREAVEHIPIEGEMNILLKTTEGENQEDGPFSRTQVEAFPSLDDPYSTTDERHLIYITEGTYSLTLKLNHDATTEDPDPEETHYASNFEASSPTRCSNPRPPYLHFAYKETETNSLVYSTEGYQVGYRGDVESPPITLYTNPFTTFYEDHFSNMRDFGQVKITKYKVWTPLSPPKSITRDPKIVCNFESWSMDRLQPMDFKIYTIDPFSCTHLIYTFAGLDSETFTITSLKPERDIVRGAYKSIVSLKEENPKLKVMIGLGGWEEGGMKYSEMVSTKERRDVFIDSVVTFMNEYGFDGLDLDWEYSGSSDRGGRATDKENLVLLTQEIQTAFDARGWILTMTVPIAKTVLDPGYDLLRLSNAIDFFNLMVYDLRGPWDGQASHHAPLRPSQSDVHLHTGLNLEEGVRLFVNNGVPKSKLVVGVPFYGRTFTLQDPQNNTPGSPISGMGKEGKYTQTKGFISYFEICMNLRNGGWKVMTDDVGGPYMTKEDQWIGYEDVTSLERKVNLIKNEQLGGVAIWALDLDDYFGKCGTKWPLLSAIRRVLSTPKPLNYKPKIFPKPGHFDYLTESSSSNSGDKGSSTTVQINKNQTDGIVGSNIVSVDNFSCSEPGYYRRKSSCRVYYICDEEAKAYRFECPEGMAFDLRRRICSWETQVICGDGYSPLSLTRRITCGENGLYSDPTNCKNYVWCKNGDAVKLSCPLDLYFDSRTGICTSMNDTFCIPGEMAKVPGGEQRSYVGTSSEAVYQTRSDDYKVVCYFASWSWIRPSGGSFVPEHIDPHLCTHIIYAFAILDPTSLEIRSPDSWTDLDNNFYQRILALRNYNTRLKVFLGLGGWTDSSGDKYSRLVNNPEARKKFVKHTTALLNAYEFDGLEFHWEYPVCWQIDCSQGPATDKQGFAALIRELRQAFIQQPKPFGLAAAVSPARAIISRAYDIRTLSSNLDFINVMTYDYHGFWESKTGHVAPLYLRENDKYESQNTDFSIKFWIQGGADSNKLILGIPLYGQTFTLENPSQNGLNAPVSGPGNRGTLTLQRGMLSYAEICQNVRKPGWTKYTDNFGNIGPFATKGDQWVSYDDPAMIKKKGDYIRSKGLGGAMVWTIDLDDFGNLCCKEPMPLLRALNRELRTIPYPPPRPGGDCTKPSPPVTPPPPIPTTTYAGGRPTKPTTEFGDLLASTTKKPERTTWKIPAATKPTKVPWWLTSPSSAIRLSTTTTTTTTARSTTKTTTPRTTWWWKPPTSTTTRKPSLLTSPSTTTRRTTTIKRTKPTTTTTERTTTTVRQPPGSGSQIHPGSPCTTQQYVPHPSDCSRFLRCHNKEFVESTCVPGLQWNDRKKICDWPNNAKCSPAGPAAVPTPTLTTRKPSTRRPQTRPTTPRTTRTTTRRTTRPTTPRTTRTTTRRTTPRTTPRTTSRATHPVTWWRPPLETSKRTTWRWTPSTVPSTIKTTKKTTTTQRTTPGEPAAPTERCQGHQSKGVPGFCTRYYQCIRGKFKLRVCPHSLHWNAKKKVCDWPSASNCMTSLLRTTTPGTVKPEPEMETGPTGPTEGGSCTGGDIVAVQGDCNAFLMCNQGKYLKKNCATKLHWNAVKKICDWPNSANCKIKPGSHKIPAKPTISITAPPPPDHIVSLEQAPTAGPLSGDFMVVCYFTNWATYRSGAGKYTPDDIDENICTHIVYGFAVLDSTNLVIKPHDSWSDIDNKFYERVTALRYKGKKVTIAIGGWNDSAGDKYNRFLTNPAARTKFVTHVLQFIEKHNFDGLDLDYEYPACPQVKCDQGDSREKQGFSELVMELSAAFKPKGLLLSAAVSPSKKVIDAGYEVPVLNKYLDWIAVMTYDFHGHWDKKTGHVAPMYYHPDDDYDYFNADYAIRYWIEKGADKRNIVMGMPLYGQSFTLNNPSITGLNSPASQKGKAGEFTAVAGFLAYYEICKNILDGWTVVKDPQERMGPYAYHKDQWVSFDNIAMLKKKSEYIREMGLGGGMVWALDLDDFGNMCGQGKHPLMKAIQSVLAPAMDGTSIPPQSPKIVTMPVGGTETDVYKVVCYYTNWSWYRQGEGKYLPENVDTDLCTHVNYGFVVLDGNTLTLKPHDTWADIDNKFYERVTSLKKGNKVKVLVALGGWNDSKGPKYSKLANDPLARKRFNDHALNFIQKYGFDGLDLDWEYPKCWQVNCDAGPESDKQAFSDWIMELRVLFRPHGLLLTAAVSPSYKVIKWAYDVPVLSQYLDFINVMTYDFHGHWDKKTGHVSPIFPHPSDEEPKFNTDFTINHWIDLGADPKKLILGMPMYGQSFALAESKNNGLNQKSYGRGEAGPYTKAGGFLSYYEICYFIKHSGWKVVRDPLGTMGPYAYRGTQWVGFDDIPTIKFKSEYIKKKGLGGGMIWALDLDDFKNRCGCGKNPLLTTINRVLRNYPPPAEECPLLGGHTKLAKPTTTTIAPHVPQPQPQPQPVDDVFGASGASCKAGEFKRHINCGKFYECYELKLQEVSCFHKLHFDGKGGCTTPAKAKCLERRDSIPPISVSESPIQPPKIIHSSDDSRFGSEGGRCKTGEFKKHFDCNKFFECLHGKLRKRNCFPGLQWDGKGRCVWPNEANCRPTGGAPFLPDIPVTTEQTKPVKILTTTRKTTTRTTPATPRTTTQKTSTSTRWYVPWTPSTKATTPRPTHAPGSLEIHGFKVVCYFTNWAWYRRGLAKYKPEHIDPDLCTHVIYGFAVLDSTRLLIKPHDTWADYDNNFYEKVTGLKAKGIRVLIAIGGWNDSKGGKYSKLVNNPASRAKFTEHVVQFIEKHNFDGLDLDWEYPKCWQVDCKKGPDSDKDGFSAWMRELKAAFKSRNWLLTAAISPSADVINNAYHVRDLMQYLDFVNVMTYDYHGHWDKKTGHVAPMYHHPESTNEKFNANYTIHYLLEKGADRKKLIMGMPLYGQAFTLSDPQNNSLNAPGTKGQAGEFTRAAGFLAYYEICDRVLKKGYHAVRDPSGTIGPYAYHGKQWVGFDDVTMIEVKSNYIKNMNLGGGMIWALDLDDFNNRCNCERHPLLRTINRVLRNYPPATKDCSLVNRY